MECGRCELEPKTQQCLPITFLSPEALIQLTLSAPMLLHHGLLAGNVTLARALFDPLSWEHAQLEASLARYIGVEFINPDGIQTTLLPSSKTRVRRACTDELSTLISGVPATRNWPFSVRALCQLKCDISGGSFSRSTPGR